MALACLESDTLPPLTMFKAIRTRWTSRLRARLSHPCIVGTARIDFPEVVNPHEHRSVALSLRRGAGNHVIEAKTSSATVTLAAEAYGVEPGRIAKTLHFASAIAWC